MTDILELTEEMARNYDALCNMQIDYQITRPIGARGNRIHGKRKRKIKYDMLVNQDFKCLDCGIQFETDADGDCPEATFDHIIPSRYGSCLSYNRELVCESCNLARDSNSMHHVIRVFGNVFGTKLVTNQTIQIEKYKQDSTSNRPFTILADLFKD